MGQSLMRAQAGGGAAWGYAYPIPLKPRTAARAGAVAVAGAPVAQRPQSDPVRTERREIDQRASAHAIRSPAVLGFAGVVAGLLLSAGLIALVAGVLALCQVAWHDASQYCAVTVLAVFGTAAAVLYRDAAGSDSRLLGYIELRCERRRDPMHLSSIDALENLRNANNWARRRGPAELRQSPPPASALRRPVPVARLCH